MESIKQTASKSVEEIGKNVKQNASRWSEVAKELVDKLTGKDMAVTYEFINLVIDIPKATGPGGKELGSAKWKVNGKFIITTELHDKPGAME